MKLFSSNNVTSLVHPQEGERELGLHPVQPDGRLDAAAALGQSVGQGAGLVGRTRQSRRQADRCQRRRVRTPFSPRTHPGTLK